MGRKSNGAASRFPETKPTKEEIEAEKEYARRLELSAQILERFLMPKELQKVADIIEGFVFTREELERIQDVESQLARAEEERRKMSNEIKARLYWTKKMME